MAQDAALFAKGKARWLLENARKLAPEQCALLLAVAELEIAAGHQLTAEERAALEEISAQAKGYDPAEIQRAAQHMVKAKTKRKVVEWPKDLKRKARSKKT